LYLDRYYLCVSMVTEQLARLWREVTELILLKAHAVPLDVSDSVFSHLKRLREAFLVIFLCFALDRLF
jgi:hypothetical protein